MTYATALKKSNGNAAHCTGEPYLALAVSVLCAANPGIAAEPLFNGAKAAGHTGSSLPHVDAGELIRLMFDGMGV